jgi:hypothetical protein
MSDHPITPPPELLKQWEDDWFQERENADVLLVNAYAAGALAGADAELEACCELLVQQGFDLVDYLHAARRPKPPSLKEQALGAMGRFTTNAHTHADEMMRDFDIIRRALEQLDD